MGRFIALHPNIRAGTNTRLFDPLVNYNCKKFCDIVTCPESPMRAQLTMTPTVPINSMAVCKLGNL